MSHRAEVMGHLGVVAKSDTGWMRYAIALARTALYVPSAKPRVGCVIVRNGRLLAWGVTQKAGEAHAEAMALKDLARRGLTAHGAPIYVSLEPCSHHGRTPPCAQALVRAQPA